MIYGYIRVSTKGQSRDGNSVESQNRALKNAGAEEIFTDVFTGRKMDRPEFEKLLAAVQPGDKIIVTKLDRFARTISGATELITELIDRGIKIEVLNLGTLDNSSMSTLFRNMLLAFAQFERDMIAERTEEGKAIARMNADYKEGRPKKFLNKQIEHAMELLETHTYNEVVQMTGISKSTLVRAKRQNAAAAVLNSEE